MLSGCDVAVQGRRRPLVKHQEIRGELETVVEHQADQQKTDASERKSTSDVFEERVRLKTNGDVYHPDLLNYNVMVGTGLGQQHLDSDDESGWSTGRLDEYNASVNILQAKPYSGTLDASKSQDLVSRPFLAPLRADNQSESAAVLLRPESWPMTFQYSKSDTRQEGFNQLAPDFFARTDERFRYSLGHDFSKLSHMHFDFDRTDSLQESRGAEIDTTTDTYTLAHDYTFGDEEQHRVDSLFNYTDQTGSFEYQNLRAQERLKLQHTPSLLSRYDLQYTELQRDTLTDQQVRGQAGIEHKLFESLVTRLDGFASQANLGDQTDLRQYGGILGLNYQKQNPLGVLLCGYSADYTRSDQQAGNGKGVVIGESHTVNSIVPIELDHTDIDITTVRIRSASGGFFQSGDDYVLSERDGRVFVTTFVVGGVTPPNFTEGQEFLVDYEYFVEPRRQDDTCSSTLTCCSRCGTGRARRGRAAPAKS
jgi:hypothetical protein